MAKVNEVVRRETGYIALWVLVFSGLMQAVFLIGGWWTLSALWGNLLGGAAAVGNFFAMGLTVQRAVEQENKRAAAMMKLSQTLRLLAQFLVAVAGVWLAQTSDQWTVLLAVLLPLLFPRVAIALRPLFDKKSQE